MDGSSFSVGSRGRLENVMTALAKTFLIALVAAIVYDKLLRQYLA